MRGRKPPVYLGAGLIKGGALRAGRRLNAVDESTQMCQREYLD
jgi:hypothetical protein